MFVRMFGYCLSIVGPSGNTRVTYFRKCFSTLKKEVGKVFERKCFQCHVMPIIFGLHMGKFPSYECVSGGVEFRRKGEGDKHKQLITALISQLYFMYTETKSKCPFH